MLPIGVFLLIVILLFEFDSVRKMLIVLATVPLAGVGVIPGLLIGRQPFGFMSLLGVIALSGVVVNNVIMLVDVVHEKQAAGASLADALVASIEMRARPFFLTMATTMAGLIPLAFSSAPLWPPMAWAMISGLVASTALSVMLVPALYAALFRRELRATASLGHVVAPAAHVHALGDSPRPHGPGPSRFAHPSPPEALPD